MDIWSIPSSDTSAAAYHAFVRHNLAFPGGKPFAWLLRGSLQETLIARWEESSETLATPGGACTSKKSVGGYGSDAAIGPCSLRSRRPGSDHPDSGTRTRARGAGAHAGATCHEWTSGRRIVDKLQELSELRRLRTARILVVNLYFNEKLSDIPPEHVGLARSQGYLTFVESLNCGPASKTTKINRPCWSWPPPISLRSRPRTARNGRT